MQEKNRTKNMKENHPVREICSWRRSIQNWKTGTSERPLEFSVARIIQSRRLRTPLQQCRKNTDAVRSFPAGSASGPDGLRPQHLLDLLNNQESSAAFLSSLTD